MPLWFVLFCIGMALLIIGWLFWDMRREAKRQPPAVRISPEWLQRNQEEVIHRAIRQPHQTPKPGFTRNQ